MAIAEPHVVVGKRTWRTTAWLLLGFACAYALLHEVLGRVLSGSLAVNVVTAVPISTAFGYVDALTRGRSHVHGVVNGMLVGAGVGLLFWLVP